MFSKFALVPLVLLAFPIVAQEEEENDSRPFFSISTNRTWTPAEKPQLQLWGQGVKQLQFRLYKVNDPVRFFELLEDEHQFGGQAPRRDEKKLTWIERLHQWKLRQRTRVQNTVRAQFTKPSRVEIRAWRTGEVPKPKPVAGAKPSVTEFANVPVLNQQQLVATWTQPFAPKNRWDSATVDIPVRGKGLYLVEATDGRLQAYTIASVSDIAIVTKTTTGRLLSRVVRRDNGAPVDGASLIVWLSADKKRLLETTTKADGFTDLKVAEKDPDGLMVLARKGEDFSVVSLYGGGVANDEERSLTSYIYTDRPVYRPGHTVYYKAIFRHREALGYRVPDGREVDVEVDDTEGNPVHRKKLRVSKMGTVNGSFELPAGAALGHYSLAIKSGDSVNGGTFAVEEYKKPEYEVKVNPEVRRVVQGANLKATIEARYFYGEPVANAKVTWVVHKSRYYLPYNDEGDDDNGQERDSSYEQREQILEESGTLDADGKITVTIPTGAADFDLRYRIEARVTDQAEREISGASFAIATVGPYYIRIDSEQYVYEPGARGAFLVETKDYDGNPVPNVAFHVDLREYRWRGPQGELVSSIDGRTDAQGKARVEMKVTSGSLIARATSRTPNGREVGDGAYVWVSGGASWYGARSERIEIVPDRKSYKPGETAKVLIVAGQPNSNVWVTVEGRAIHETRFVTSKDATVSVNIPIRKEYAPNFFVSAVIIRNNEQAYGTRTIKVPADEHTLKVEREAVQAGVQARRTRQLYSRSARPRGQARRRRVQRRRGGRSASTRFVRTVCRTSSVSSTAANGTASPPTTRCTTTSAARPASAACNWRAFARGTRARTSNPNRWCSRKCGRRSPIPRYWSAEVNTDSIGPRQGRTRVSRIRSPRGGPPRAASRADTKVGSVINRVIVRKNLLIRLTTPRFFRLGDEMTLTAIAQNYLGREKTGPRFARSQRPGHSRRRHARSAHSEQGHRHRGLQGPRAAPPRRPSYSSRRSPTKSPTPWS